MRLKINILWLEMHQGIRCGIPIEAISVPEFNGVEDDYLA